MATLDQILAERQQRRQSTEQQGLGAILSQAPRATLGAVGAVGNLLDLPGSSVRDVLSGQNPLDQWLSPLSAKNRVTGRQMLRKAGVARGRDNWGNFGAGLAAEIALDPLTYLTLGGSALTKSGKIAVKAGALDRATDVAKILGKANGKRVARQTVTLNDLFRAGGTRTQKALQEVAGGADKLSDLLRTTGDEPLSHGARWMGMDLPSLPGKPVSRGLDWLGTKAAKSGAGRFGRMLFDYSVRGKYGKSAQKLAHLATKESEALAPEAWRHGVQFQKQIDDLQADLATDPSLLNHFRPHAGGSRSNPHGIEIGSMVSETGKNARRGKGQVVEITSDETVVKYTEGETGEIKTVRYKHDRPNRLKTMNKAGSLDSEQHSQNMFRRAIEESVRYARETGDVDTALDKFFSGQKVGSEVKAKIAETGEFMAKNMDPIVGRMQDLGINLKEIEDLAYAYAPRSVHKRRMADESFLYQAPKEFAAAFENARKRSDEIRTVPAQVVNDMLNDKATRNSPEYILEKFGEFLSDYYKGWVDPSKVDPSKHAWGKSRDEFLSTAPKASDDVGVSFEKLANGLEQEVIGLSDGPIQREVTAPKKGAPGVSVEPSKLRGVDVPDEVNVVWRDSNGDAGGIMNIFLDADGKPELLSIAVSESHRRKGIASKLFEAAKEKYGNKAVEAASGAGGYTDEGARFAHSRQVRDAVAEGLPVPEEVLGEYGLESGFTGELVEGVGKEAHASALADWLDGRQARDLFTQGLTRDVQKWHDGAHKAMANAEAIYQLLSQDDVYQDGVHTLEKVFKASKLNPEKAAEVLAKRLGQSADEILQSRVSDEAAAAISSSMGFHTSPEWQSKVLETIDWVTQAWKSGVTAVGGMPSFQVRNLFSGQYMNMVASGAVQNLSDAKAYASQVKRANQFLNRMRSGKNLKDGDKALLEELQAFGILDRTHSHDVFGSFEDAMRDRQQLPAQLKEWFTSTRPYKEARDRAGKAVNKLPNPPSERMGQIREAIGTMGEVGSDTNQLVEFYNRAPLFMMLREKGWTAHAAAEKVFETQFNYGRLAPFEKGVMKRLMPFYSFQRLAAPAVIKTLLERPGGAQAQTIRLYNYVARERPENAVRPDYLSNQFAIHRGTKEDGSESFFTASGLPFEATLGMLPSSASTAGVQDAAYGVAGMMNPAIQAPLEMMTNRSFFQGGRELSSLDPTVGRTMSNIGEALGMRDREEGPVQTPVALERALNYSPFSRVTTRLRQATDPRKNLLEKLMMQTTGFRVTDVSPEQQTREVERRYEQMMRDLGAQEYSRVYFPKRLIANMSPERKAQAERINELMRQLRNRK